MNRAFLPSLVRPALPLRKPASSPGSVNSSSTMPVTPQGDCSPQPQTQLTGSLDVGPNRNENEQTPVQINSPKVGSITMNLCNYCSKQGNLRCTSCKKTFYCSVACQTEDWRAHRHICKLSAQGNAASHKTNPSPSTPCGDEASVLESKINSGLVVEPKRIYVRDLRKNNISKGNEVQAVVVEIRTPAKFFIHIQSVEMAETLKSITVNLQKAYSGSLASVYKPEVGELCAVKFSLDQNWYRGGIESVDLHHQTAKVLYIDFGNEEEVKFDQIRPMMANIGSAPPCAMQCFIAGVTAVTGSWTGECCMLLRQLVAGKSLNFTVVNVLNSSTVFAVDAPLSTFGKNLSTFLIDKGYAIQDNSSTKPKIKQDIHSLMTASLENFKRLSDGKNKNNEAQPPDPLSQEVGDIFIAIVTHLQSPSEIICQKLENARIIQELQKSLRDQCCKTQAGENFRPAPGTVCCSLFSEDNQWYRAKVLGYSSEDRVCVGYIDFGNSEEVPLNQLRPISMDLLSLATQAIPCALAGINPTSDVWSEETVAVLKKLVCNRFIRVEILGEHDGKALVSMVDESSDPQTNVAELLVATGLAVVANLKPKKGEACESPDKLKWSCVKLPADGQKVVLVISVLESPGQFYCYNYNEDVLQTLTELSTALMKHCGADGTPFTPAVGEPCCALFSDGSWYRGIVQSLEGDGNVKVYFVDYGNTCEVQTSHLRAITPSLLKHPFQAISCWLAGIQPVDREWSKDAVQEFQTLCVGKQLNGRVLSVTEKGYGLELECNGCNVAAVLIAEQLAKPLSQKNKPEFQATSFTEPAEASSALEPAANDARIKQPAEITGQQLATPQSSTAIESASFPLDWKTVELPHGEPFQLQVAAVTSPGLFYVLNPREVKIEKLQCVMMDVMRYCSKQTLPNQSMPLPGAACCAQFSGDKNWYRAVVLEATSTYASVIYADYGNMERVSITSLLPIPKTLLQHPFQIARCALSGKEHFPTVWPVDVLELFGKQMSGKIMASVDHFDGTFNLLNVTEHSTQGGSSINFNILGLLKKSGKSSKKSTTKDTQEQEMEKTQPVCTPSVLAENLSTDTGNASGKENIKTVSASLEPTDPQTSADSTAVTTSNASASARYKALEEKIAHIEELLLLLLNHLEPKQ